MQKRSFRSVPPASQGPSPRYPTLDDFDRSSRRGFLARIGAVLAGAGGLALLGACGERRVGGAPDEGNIAGGAPMPPAPLDGGVPDSKPDQWPIAGGARPLDARADQEVPVPTPGEAPLMDARVDGCTNPPTPPTPPEP